MKFFIVTVNDFEIRIAIRAESDDDSIIGDAMQIITPSKSFMGMDFDKLSKLGIGVHDIKIKE